VPDPADEEAGPPRAQRIRGLVERARRPPPATLGETGTDGAATQATLIELGATLARLEDLAWAGRHDTQGGIAAIGNHLGHLDRILDDLTQEATRIDAAVAAQATALHRAVAAPARRAAADALRHSLGPAPDLRPGLTVFTLCWNHGELLAESVRSGLAVLDQLPDGDHGSLLVFDDASTDRTHDVVITLAIEDSRVRVISSPVNLGLALARTTLLHAAETTHAFHLDADNTALPDGVTSLYRAAKMTDAALTYGTVVQVDANGVSLGPISNEPIAPALFRSNYVDTMAVTDVATFRRLGGWSSDPLLEHVDDWAAVLRLAEAGELVAFVPALVGRHRVLETSFHRTVADPRLGARRVARVLDPVGRRHGDDPMAGVAACAVHPDVGPLWASPEAVALRPALAPPPLAAVEVRAPGRRVLVVAPGGVANLGDDAIGVRGIERLRAAFGPDVAVDLLTDGSRPVPGLGSVRWLGPLLDVVAGLDLDALGPLDADLAAAADRVRVGHARWAPLDPTAYDACVVLGGGTLASTWSDGLIAPRAVLGAALRASGVPYACSGQGVGPLDTRADRALVGGLFGGAVAVSCRDGASAALARALLGAEPASIEVTGDDALGLKPSDRAAATGRGGHRRVLAVTVRRAEYVSVGASDGSAMRWMAAADALAAERDWDVLGVALNSQGPEPEIATLAQVRATEPMVARWRLVDCGPDPRRLAEVVSTATAVAAQSFHAALLALDAGVPAVLAAETRYYRVKADGLAETTGLPPSLAVTDPSDLGAALDAVSAAVAQDPHPLARATAEVDTWWTKLPTKLGVKPVSG